MQPVPYTFRALHTCNMVMVVLCCGACRCVLPSQLLDRSYASLVDHLTAQILARSAAAAAAAAAQEEAEAEADADADAGAGAG